MAEKHPKTGRPAIAICAKCSALIIDDEIVWYGAQNWTAYCWPCFKANYLPNLTRLQEENPT